MKTVPLVKLVTHAIEDIKGLDVKVLDVAPLTTITDHMPTLPIAESTSAAKRRAQA